jgi:hypothetical protein
MIERLGMLICWALGFQSADQIFLQQGEEHDAGVSRARIRWPAWTTARLSVIIFRRDVPSGVVGHHRRCHRARRDKPE